jgi:orotate phosphoribosyltransferase
MDLVAASIHWLCDARNIAADVIAGGETAGIPFAAFIAQRLSKPMIYVRKATKDHGVQSLVEGNIVPGQTVLLVEDLITDGGSKEGFISGIRQAGGRIQQAVVILDRLQGGKESLAKLDVILHCLCSIDDLIELGASDGHISLQQAREIRNYLADAERWHRDRGLPFGKKGDQNV